jgi:parvulin-like peptidyl-prolyl isomerase
MKILLLVLGWLCVIGSLSQAADEFFPKAAEEINKPYTTNMESDGIVARVNNDIITDQELTRMTVMLKPISKNNVLKTMIKEHLLYQAALNENTKISDTDVNEALNQQIKQYGSEKVFEKNALEPLHLTLAQYKEDIRRQLVREKFIMSKMGSFMQDKSIKVDFFIDTFVTPKEIMEYYETHKTDFLQAEQIQTRQIILKIKNSSERMSKQGFAEALLDEINNKGADFEALARKYSDVKADSGGLWDWAPKGSFSKEIEDIIYQLKIGDISPVIQTENNIRIIKVEGLKGGADIKNLDNSLTQERIRRILINQKLVGGAEKLVRELTRNARIWPSEIMLTEEPKEEKLIK